jgi:putative tricarboxylic transport membrane protein
MKDLDRVSGFFFFFFSLWIVYESLKLPTGSFHQPEAGFLPLGLALALLVLSIFLIVQSFKEKHVKEWLTLGGGKIGVGLAVVSMAAYVVVLNKLGFLASTTLITGFLLKGIERQKWTTTLVITVPAVVITYFVFSRWLGVPLPKGIIPV